MQNEHPKWKTRRQDNDISSTTTGACYSPEPILTMEPLPISLVEEPIIYEDNSSMYPCLPRQQQRQQKQINTMSLLSRCTQHIVYKQPKWKNRHKDKDFSSPTKSACYSPDPILSVEPPPISMVEDPMIHEENSRIYPRLPRHQQRKEQQVSTMSLLPRCPCSPAPLAFTLMSASESLASASSESSRAMERIYDQDTWRMYNRIKASRRSNNDTHNHYGDGTNNAVGPATALSFPQEEDSINIHKKKCNNNNNMIEMDEGGVMDYFLADTATAYAESSASESDSEIIFDLDL